MDLPFVYLPEVYHAGALVISNQCIQRRLYIQNSDFEFGLLSVSLDPAVWAASWAAQNATTYELTSPERSLRLLDADLTLKQFAPDIKRCAIRDKLLVVNSNSLQGTQLVYNALELTPSYVLSGAGRTTDDWTLQTCLAVLTFKDSSIDGLWWSDTLNGAMRSERGGIHQHLLSRITAHSVTLPVSAQAPPPIWEQSQILV